MVLQFRILYSSRRSIHFLSDASMINSTVRSVLQISADQLYLHFRLASQATASEAPLLLLTGSCAASAWAELRWEEACKANDCKTQSCSCSYKNLSICGTVMLMLSPPAAIHSKHCSLVLEHVSYVALLQHKIRVQEHHSLLDKAGLSRCLSLAMLLSVAALPTCLRLYPQAKPKRGPRLHANLLMAQCAVLRNRNS